MGVELVYHDFDDETPYSPFEETLARLSDDASLGVACPYLGLDIVRSIAERAQTWRLVTDVQEWCRSQSSEQRDALLEFLQENAVSIHDCRGLHAKVLVNDDAGLVGSANVTYSGLTRNSEMAVLFEDTGEVNELSTWFEVLWDRTQPPDIEDLRTYLSEARRVERDRPSNPSMSHTGPSIEASLQILDEPVINVDESEHRQLVQTVSQGPNRAWADVYFDWVAEAIECARLDESDERIATTVPTTSTRLPVNVNHRYVLAAFPTQRLIGIILPPDSSALDDLSEFLSDFGAFSTDSDSDPYWFEFPGDPDEFITDEIKQDWREMIRKERSRGDRSEYRRHHSSAAYKAAVDNRYRERVLDSSFQDQE